MAKKRVLVLCTGNSARSQMAEGLLRHEAGASFDVESAGTNPSRVRPEAITVMKELGIDISGHRSKSVDEFAGRQFHYVITVCDHARDHCPVFPTRTQRLHWSFEDLPLCRGVKKSALLRSGGYGTRSTNACALSYANRRRCRSARIRHSIQAPT